MKNSEIRLTGKNSHTFSYLLVALAATLWGTIGIYIDQLTGVGFSVLEIVAFRVSVSTILLWIFLRIKAPELLKIDWNDFHLFFGTGVMSILFFNWSYFTSISETSLSIAVVLLYTGPIFVVILARLFFKEKITKRKQIALFLTLAGVVLVSELYPESGNVSAYGLIVGIGAGFGYALYSIFSKLALKKYQPFTILFYTFLTATVFILPFSGLVSVENAIKLNDTTTLLTVFGLALFPTVLAYLFYTEGLKEIEAGKASITAMAEPVAATLIGIFWFEELLSGLQIIGMMLVLFSVLLVQKRRLR